MKLLFYSFVLLSSFSSLAMDYADEMRQSAKSEVLRNSNYINQQREKLYDYKRIKAEEDPIEYETLKWPKREFSIIVSEEGYLPKRMTVFVGEMVKFNVTSTLEEPACFFIQEREVFLSAKQGRVTSAEVTFEMPGEYMYYCPALKTKGLVHVIPRPKYLPKIKRGIASSPEHDWRPKDF